MELVEKIPFSWLYKNSKNKRTKNILKELKNGSKVKLKEPVSIGKNKIWLNENNQLRSLKTFSEIFKERDHTRLSGFLTKKDKIIVDLGANEGFYTLMAKAKSPKARIISVEPNPYAFKLLKKNVKSNKLKGVSIINKAVSSKKGKIDFEVVKGRTAIGATKVYKKYRKLGLEKIKVDTISLDQLLKNYKLERIDVLKIDVEGSEVEILKSSKNSFNKIKKIVVEYHGAQKTKSPVLKLLSENGFKKLMDHDEKFYGEFYLKRK